ncbi:hypothetical protein [Longirhabdus pacifica]|uniref:hypothetical protein n=1 Tax=Longirhabdus pacifica TaxID=2305227 RepID=UPI0010091DEA|nr:hypothetical protein [Longirhabdus pacifica]
MKKKFIFSFMTVLLLSSLVVGSVFAYDQYHIEKGSNDTQATAETSTIFIDKTIKNGDTFHNFNLIGTLSPSDEVDWYKVKFDMDSENTGISLAIGAIIAHWEPFDYKVEMYDSFMNPRGVFTGDDGWQFPFVFLEGREYYLKVSYIGGDISSPYEFEMEFTKFL